MELILFPLFGISIGIAILISYQRKQREEEVARQKEEKLGLQFASLVTSKCPQCAEEIKIEAKVCRHCGIDVTEHNRREDSTKAPLRMEFQQTQWKKEFRREKGQFRIFPILSFLFVAAGVLASLWVLVLVGLVLMGLYGFAVWGVKKKYGQGPE
jgi:hypothetical protein